MNNKLTPAQWALYRFLKDRGDVWTTQYRIARELGNDHPEYFYDGDPTDFHDSLARSRMTADIRKINDSGVIQKIIISSPRGIKLANEEEFDKYIRFEIDAALRRLVRAKRKAEKASKNNQVKITFGEYERDIIEAFIPSGK